MSKEKEVTYPMIVLLEAALMENGEVIHFGKSLGYINKKQLDLVEKGATKTARGNEPIVAIGSNVA